MGWAGGGGVRVGDHLCLVLISLGSTESQEIISLLVVKMIKLRKMGDCRRLGSFLSSSTISWRVLQNQRSPQRSFGDHEDPQIEDHLRLEVILQGANHHSEGDHLDVQPHTAQEDTTRSSMCQRLSMVNHFIFIETLSSKGYLADLIQIHRSSIQIMLLPTFLLFVASNAIGLILSLVFADPADFP